MSGLSTMTQNDRPVVAGSERFQTVIVGGGQAGLAVGYHLARRGLPFVILDAGEHIGDSWRKRWDSLRLFTPARYAGLPGLPFPASRWSYATKDKVADYLQAYAARFNLPVRTSVRIDGLSRAGSRYGLTSGDHWFEADNVVVASGAYQCPRVPPFASELDRGIVQLHSSDYRNPSQLRDGGVLVVGAGNSGAEIAREASHSHRTWLSGRHPGHLPVRIESRAFRLFAPLLWIVFSRLLTMNTPIGRKARPWILSHGAPLIRVKPKDLAAAGIERVPKIVGVHNGVPVLEDGRVLDVSNIIWCTGFQPDFSWINLPVFSGDGEPAQERGVVPSEPGLYFVGRPFLYAFSSEMIGGVGKDADHIASQIASREANGQSTKLARSEAQRPNQTALQKY